MRVETMTKNKDEISMFSLLIHKCMCYANLFFKFYHLLVFPFFNPTFFAFKFSQLIFLDLHLSLSYTSFNMLLVYFLGLINWVRFGYLTKTMKIQNLTKIMLSILITMISDMEKYSTNSSPQFIAKLLCKVGHPVIKIFKCFV